MATRPLSNPARTSGKKPRDTHIAPTIWNHNWKHQKRFKITRMCFADQMPFPLPGSRRPQVGGWGGTRPSPHLQRGGTRQIPESGVAAFAWSHANGRGSRQPVDHLQCLQSQYSSQQKHREHFESFESQPGLQPLVAAAHQPPGS